MVASTVSRKQQEIKVRDQLILSAASLLFAEQGYHGTTMQNIADAVDYSKGTIYQHYTCKEEVLAKLFLQCSDTLQASMQKIINKDFHIRDTILLISGIFLKHTKDEPGIAGNVTLVQSLDFVAKLSQDSQKQLLDSERIMLSQVISIFSNYPEFDAKKVKSAAFGWWSMQLGVQNIMVSGWKIETMGFKSPEEHIIESLNVFITGLGISTMGTCESWLDVKKKMQKTLDINTF
jgi:AcrR family transcriptional regulator